MAKIAFKNAGKPMELGANVVDAFASTKPKTVLSTLPDVIYFLIKLVKNWTLLNLFKINESFLCYRNGKGNTKTIPNSTITEMK